MGYRNQTAKTPAHAQAQNDRKSVLERDLICTGSALLLGSLSPPLAFPEI